MRVVKAFNIIFGLVLAKDGRYDALIAAADANAKARISSLLESLSLPSRDIGGLHMPDTRRNGCNLEAVQQRNILRDHAVVATKAPW